MLLQKNIGNISMPPPPIPDQGTEQRGEQRVNAEQQQVIDDTPIITLNRITNAPAIMTSHNPTTKQNIKTTLVVHHRVTWNNTPGGIPLIK
jgi:hypothetical protein